MFKILISLKKKNNGELKIQRLKEIEQEQEAPEFLYTTLLQCEKTFLSCDELDELFGISHLEPDSKKSKRHRFLAELNVNHPGFITKSKDQTDKRRFNYKIVK